MRLTVYATNRRGNIFRIGRLAELGRSFQLRKINLDTGDISNVVLGVGDSILGCKQVFGSFHWTFRCSGCGFYIRGNRQYAKKHLPEFVPEVSNECHYWPCEAAMVKGQLPATIPEQLAKYFDGQCWAGEECAKNLDAPHDCQSGKHSHRKLYPSCRNPLCPKD